MQINPLFLMEFVLFSGVALAWGIYEYLSVQPKKRGSRPRDAGHAEGEHGADDR